MIDAIVICKKTLKCKKCKEFTKELEGIIVAKKMGRPFKIHTILHYCKKCNIHYLTGDECSNLINIYRPVKIRVVDINDTDNIQPLSKTSATQDKLTQADLIRNKPKIKKKNDSLCYICGRYNSASSYCMIKNIKITSNIRRCSQFSKKAFIKIYYGGGCSPK